MISLLIFLITTIECPIYKELLIDSSKAQCNYTQERICLKRCYNKKKNYRKYYQCAKTCEKKAYCDPVWIEFINTQIKR